MTCCKPFCRIVRSAMDAWNRAKKRRNIHVPQSRGNAASTPKAVTHVAQVQVAEAEVEEATSALKLTEDGFEADEDAGDLADFDYEY